MKELEEENRRLKKIYAEERLKDKLIAEAMQKVVAPSRRREMAQWAIQEKAVSIRLA